MDNYTEASQILDKALKLINSGQIGDSLIRHRGKVEQPIVVVDADDKPESWFVGVIVDERIAGFLQLDLHGRLRRYSSFQRRSETLEGCPPAKDWLDPETILGLVRARVDPGATLSVPTLSYDRSPDKIVWRINIVDQSGQASTVFVAGNYAYFQSPDDQNDMIG
ncbi:MAG TPA: hypothetical protein PLQ56_10995 [Aggregatilineales bacterium]|nr:hypothetical protein [Aggregatilineales bacterium]